MIVEMNTLRFPLLILLAFCAAFPLYAAPSSDAEATKLIVGKWVIPEAKGMKDGFFEFAADGTFESGATLMGQGAELKVIVSGTWKVEDGVLVEEITKSSHPDIVSAGLVTRDTITDITKDEIIYRAQNGLEVVHRRAGK